MEDLQNKERQNLKDRAWTTDEIRKHSSSWTLAGDVGLFNLLNEFSHYIISSTHEVENAVDSLVHQTKMTTAKINNVINDFHMLSNLQFVENRVYDEEVQEPVSENKPVVEKSKEQREAEMLPKIVQAIELGLAVLDTAFDRINVNEISDSEDEEDMSSEGRTILEPKDPYEHHPLPYIIGSEEFMKCDYAGLKDLVEDDAPPSFSDESSISETDETSSDEGEPLPLDEDRFSEKQNVIPSQNISDKMSSSDESELFGSEKELSGFGSESSLEEKPKQRNIQNVSANAQPQKETRQNSVSSLQSKLKLPQVLPVSKVQEKKESDDLFAVEDHSDDESPFRKKTGLFTSDMRFNDEKDDDLFGGDLFGKSLSEDGKEIKPVEVPKVTSKKPQAPVVAETKKPALFDNDEDSEDDIFNTLMKTKKTTTTKTSNAGSQDSSEKADTSSTPSSAPSTKPSGNAFDFVTGGGNHDSLFGDDSDGDDLFSSKKMQGKRNEFDSSENDDLFGTLDFNTTKEPKVSSDTKSSLFEDKSLHDQQPKKKEPEKPQIVRKTTKDSIFDTDSFEQPKNKKEQKNPQIVRKRTKDSIFEDSDSSDQEKKIPVQSPLSLPVQNKKDINLFGDDDDLEEDIFSKVSKESKLSKADEKSKPLSLFEDSEEQPTTVAPVISKTQQNKLPSLFDDSDSFDLFAPKPPVKQSEPKQSEANKPVQTKPKQPEVNKPVQSELKKSEAKPVNIPKPATVISKVKDEADDFVISKVKDEADEIITSKSFSPAKDANIDNQVSFDTPVDSSSVLNVINKGRVKVTSKRRKPTRQGRLAALENSEKEAKTDLDTPTTKTVLDTSAEDSGSIFSVPQPAEKSEPPKLNHKAQEKEKMNLMSQLISEVATSKVALRKAVEKEEDDEEGEVDIFSEATKKDRSKSSFSFRPPEENGIAAMFPIDKKEDKEDSSISKSGSFEDDFFTEPAFQNFRTSISKDSVLDMDDDDDDDLFSAIKSNALPKAKAGGASDSNDLFGDDTDIFADVQKEKYEMFPNQIYDDEDDDIFSNVNNSASNKTSSKTSHSSTVKKVETQQVNAFDDPLTGLLGED